MLKKGLDLFISASLLFIFLPLILIVSLFIKCSSHPKIFFIQPRLGYLGSEFSLIKFCTMKNIVDKSGNLLPDDKRLTGLGKFLRKTSIDELPSLLNVVKGDMSLVGPRPLLIEYKKLYSKKQFRRHEVLPGLTGWAQINGRNNISWKKKFEMDVWYVDNHSFFLDLKIIIKTIFKVVLTKDVNQKGFATMKKFKGN